MMVGRLRAHSVTAGELDERFPNPGSSVSDTEFVGNSADAEPVANDAFAFASGDDSNVVVTLDENVTDTDGRPKIKIDVYYV